jgi:hypothetical protein
MLFDDDVYDAIYYVFKCKFYECLNVIDDDVYDATHCENEEFYEYLKYY